MILEFAQAKKTIRELSNSFHPLNPIRINLLSFRSNGKLSYFRRKKVTNQMLVFVIVTSCES